MGDAFGFLKIKDRKLPNERNPLERVDDFLDVHQNTEEKEQVNLVTPQSSRCMDCGVPFCHFSCPLGNLIPEFNDLVYNSKWWEAYQRLSLTNNFPEFTGRLCPAPCEQGCVLGSIDPSVTIKNIEQTVSDIAFNRQYVQPCPAERVTNKTVAIIGSGPAGLAAAQQLSRSGHTVVVYEKDEKPGGLLRYGIPNFKLEKWIIDRRIDQLEAEGVRFRCSVEIGGGKDSDISFSKLLESFDAVLIATGATVPNDLSVQGRNLKNIHFAMEFLPNATRQALGEKIPQHEDYGKIAPLITAEGKNVLIIGGGDTGSDCLGTSLRQNAKSVTTLQVLPKPPISRPKLKDLVNRTPSQNATTADISPSAASSIAPWPIYPNLYTPSSSIEEGEVLSKSQYLWETTVKEFIGDEDGNVKAAILVDVRFENGKIEMISGTERQIDVDLVLLSIGFRGPETKKLFGSTKIELTDRGIKRGGESHNEFQTSIENVFVAGDAGRGQSLIVWAIAEGRSAAHMIDKFLEGETELPKPISPKTSALRS